MLVRTTPIRVQNAKGWPDFYSCNFLEPGLVSYQDVDAGIAMLRKETILKMLESFKGKPVIDKRHKDVTPENYDKYAVGYITRVWYDDWANWAYCEFILTDEEAKKSIADGYSVSCAYDQIVTGPGGEWHAIKYDEEILGGVGNHLALVDSPRYEGCKISECLMLVNSKQAKITNRGSFVILKNKQREDTKMIKLYRKENQKAGAEVDPKDPTKQKWNGDNLFVQVENEYVPLSELAKHAKVKNEFVELQSVENDIEVNGVVHNVAELVENYKASKSKANADEDKDKDKEKEKDNGKKNEDDDKEKEKIEKENSDDKDKEKENAEGDDKDKEKEGSKKNDKEPTKKDVKHFVSLQNARENGLAVTSVSIDTMINRVERGASRYGSGK